MTDKKLTDEEIIKALEYCNVDRGECDKCVLKRKCESYPFHSAVAEYAFDLINRQRAEIERLGKRIKGLLRNYSTADVKEVKHGEWKLCYEDWRKQIAGDECSVCGFQHFGVSISHYHYCPHCGARMETEE